jgi:hypothetical protein
MILYQICWWWFLLCFLHELLMSSLKCESAWTTCALIKSEKPNARMPALARMGQWTCMNILNGLKAWKFFVFQNARSAWLNSSMWDVHGNNSTSNLVPRLFFLTLWFQGHLPTLGTRMPHFWRAKTTHYFNNNFNNNEKFTLLYYRSFFSFPKPKDLYILQLAHRQKSNELSCLALLH